MYRELIETYASGINWVKIQPPATQAQIAEAERIAGCAFPDELRELLAELNGDQWLFFPTETIAEITQGLRESFGDFYPDIDRHIFFAGNGCGDYYCYNIREDDSADPASIFIWEHETNETKKVASDLQELICRYYQDEI